MGHIRRGIEMLKCDICGEMKDIDDLFRCHKCYRICCDDHVDDEYEICTRCREDE